MSSPNDKKGITPTNEGRNDSHLYDEDPDLVQLLAKLGIGDNDHYLSNARIEEIANSDTDEENASWPHVFCNCNFTQKACQPSMLTASNICPEAATSSILSIHSMKTA